MLTGSTRSVPHSGAILNSAVSSDSSYSSRTSSSEQPYAHCSRPTAADPPRRSVDITVAPYDDGNDTSTAANSRGSTKEGAHVSSNSNASHGVRLVLTNLLEQATSENSEQRQWIERSALPEVASASAPSNEATASAAPSTPAPDGGVSDGSRAVAGHLLHLPDSSPEELLALLSPEQLETALQLYVDRGGIRVHEVPAVLTTLPFIQRPTANLASAPSPDKDGDAEHIARPSSLLDPEGWLCAVAAAAAASDIKDAEDGSSTVSFRSPSVEADAASTQWHRYPMIRERGESSSCERLSDRSSLSQQALDATVAPCARERPAGSEGRPTEGVSPTPPTPAGRKLAFGMEEGAEDAQPRASLPGRPPRLPSSSTHSLPAQPALSATSPQARRQKRPAAQTVDNAAKRILSAISNGRLLQRVSSSASRPSSSPVPQQAYRRREAATPAGSSAAMSARSSSPPPTVVVASKAEEAGIHKLFQQCLHSPHAAATSTLSVADWAALVEELQRDRCHRLPPQAVLDDVEHTIEEEMRRSARPEGLSFSDFVRVLHTQLDEVRRDLASHPGSSPSLTDATANVELPARPSYLFTPPSAAAGSSTGAKSGPTYGASISFPPSVKQQLTNTSGLRVLPTWCMSLACFFPLELSSVCTVPVVRYLRSVGLMNAILEALVQRLELEVEAMPDTAAIPAVSLAALLSEGPSVAPKTAPGKQLRFKEVEHMSSLSSSAMGTRSPVGVSGFVWPPCAGSSLMLSMSASGGGGSGGASRCASGARPTSSVVVTSMSQDIPPWNERPEWRPAEGMDSNARTSHAHKVEGDSSGHLAARGSAAHAPVVDGDIGALVASANRKVPASATSSRQSSAGPRYLEERPLDEITVSVVARAKARRLMDSLRRNAVPINRYECFARLECEDEVVPEPLCFISEAEIEKTIGGPRDEDVSVDSDAMSDIIAALTYDPKTAAGVVLADEDANKRMYSSANRHSSTERSRVANTDQYQASVRPPQLPNDSIINILHGVFSGSTRASMMRRARASAAAAARSPPGSTPLEVGAPVTGSRGTAVGTALKLSGSHRQHQPPLPHPPPVRGMYRMAGVLLEALPRKQEKALVERLSHPLFDPRSIGLRASSASAARSSTDKGRASAVGKSADHPTRAQSARGRPHSSPPPPPYPYSTAIPNGSGSPHKDSGLARCEATYLSDVASTGTDHPAQSHQPPSASLAYQPTHRQRRRHRNLNFFNVPSVLVADPLSTVAAATAMTQVLDARAPLVSPDEQNTPPKPQPPRTAEMSFCSLSTCSDERRAPKASHHPPSQPPSMASRAAAIGKARRQPTSRATGRDRPVASRRAGAPTAQHTSLHASWRPWSGNVTHTLSHSKNRAATAVRRMRAPGRGSADTAACYSSEVTPPRRSHGARGPGHGGRGDTRAQVWYTASHEDAAAASMNDDTSMEGEEQLRDGLPPRAPMLLYERRLLRHLQRAYAAECAASN
ncbi:hypothetical protein ABL78_6529 [Leptomonas seymouri]|uniref:Uncharacterized protein n=1 Tax=Leptomonas seymouri TaxID=5684 RepID=A0A0N1PCW3_LEPSE|nr:hypothetical protein ABL78_6529 [Leptomonas seymouri]|eukprot:KPI84422.1 hypothetical protein ABL78_6529 [Leptomonas seymouri]